MANLTTAIPVVAKIEAALGRNLPVWLVVVGIVTFWGHVSYLAPDWTDF